MLPTNVSLNLTWDYKTPSNLKAFFVEPKDWNQTLITKINELSTAIMQRSYSNDGFEVVVSPEALEILKTFEYYDDENKTIGVRYKISVDSYIPPSIIYVYSNSFKNLKEIKYTVQPEGSNELLELRTKSINECSEEEVQEYKSKLIGKIEILNFTQHLNVK